MQILNIAGYHFTPLSDLNALREILMAECQKNELKGTILLSPEGINVSLAGEIPKMHAFKQHLHTMNAFAQLSFRESYSSAKPFKRLKIKLKKEIITFRQNDIAPEKDRAPSIQPHEFKQWLDEKKDITVLDTRNDYEIEFGTFHHALNLKVDDFCELAEKIDLIPRDKPIVMFCTGGVRCEKAGLFLQKQGYQDVYQLEGGILNYFAAVGGEHYEGECFVFDERVALDSSLQSRGTRQCQHCQGPIFSSKDHSCTPKPSRNLS